MVRKKKLEKIPPEKILKSKKWIPIVSKNYKLIEKNNLFIKYAHINGHKRQIRSRYMHAEIDTVTQKSKQVRIFPTKKQKHKLLIWMDIYRQTYNLTLKYLKMLKFTKVNHKGFKKTRPIIDNLIKTNHKILDTIFIKSGMVKHIRDEAINDVFKAYKTAQANKKANNITHYRIRYKKKKNMLSIEANCFSVKSNGFCITRLGIMKSEVPFGNILQTCRLVYNDKTKHFMLNIPIMYSKTLDIARLNICALDPGIRTFQSVYSPQNTLYKIGYLDNNNKNNIMNKIKHLDLRLQNIKKIGRYKKFEKRLRRKIRNIVTDMHWKTARLLCSSFNNILLGNMSTKSIIKRDNHLSAKVKRLALYLSHYKFKQRLIHKSNEFNVNFEFVDEAYTTKTCGKCACISEVGSSSIFRCKSTSCGFNKHNLTMGRDFNAARNIYLKNR